MNIILLVWEFFTQALADGFRWSLSDSKFPQVSRTLLSILADPNNAVVWKIFNHIMLSNSSIPFYKSLGNVPSASIKTDYHCHSHTPRLYQLSCNILGLATVLTFIYFHFVNQWGSKSIKRQALFLYVFVNYHLV